MPALAPTRFTGRIEWLGRVPPGTGLRAEALSEVRLTFAGIEGEAHGGLTRASCSRVTAQHPKGTEIRNVRQLSVLSAEELTQIAAEMGLGELAPEWLGASMIVSGIPDLTHVPPGARLQGPDGACIGIDMENRPCVLPGREIERERAGYGRAFKAAAEGRRGVTAWVEREGVLRVGDAVRLHVPDQRAWSHAADWTPRAAAAE